MFSFSLFNFPKQQTVANETHFTLEKQVPSRFFSQFFFPKYRKFTTRKSMRSNLLNITEYVFPNRQSFVYTLGKH